MRWGEFCLEVCFYSEFKVMIDVRLTCSAFCLQSWSRQILHLCWQCRPMWKYGPNLKFAACVFSWTTYTVCCVRYDNPRTVFPAIYLLNSWFLQLSGEMVGEVVYTDDMHTRKVGPWSRLFILLLRYKLPKQSITCVQISQSSGVWYECACVYDVKTVFSYPQSRSKHRAVHETELHSYLLKDTRSPC